MQGTQLPAVDWGALPAELVCQCCSALLRELQAVGPIGLREAARAQAALSPNRHWRAVALSVVRALDATCCFCFGPWSLCCMIKLGLLPFTKSETAVWCDVHALQLSFSVRLADWSTRHLASVRICELALPEAPAGSGQDLALAHRAALLLTNPPFHERSGGTLVALYNVPVVAATGGQLAGWAALRRLSLAPGSLLGGGGTAMPAFPPGAFPTSFQELEMPVPRHPFRIAAGLPPSLQTISLHCSLDFILGQHVFERLPPSWRQLAVHCGRAAGLDLDDLLLLHPLPLGTDIYCRSLTMHAPLAIMSTSDPQHPAMLAAPPVRSLESTLAAHLAVLAPALAAASIEQLTVVASEASFYCRRPGRLGILDAAALPPVGRVGAETLMQGYTAQLAWPAAVPRATSRAPYFALTVTRQGASSKSLAMQ